MSAKSVLNRSAAVLTHAVGLWCVAEAQEPTNLGSFFTA
jgi:hypothetical protein